jgi:hypothetical protein
MLALHGFDVYGLEVSQKGVETAEEYAVTELAQPSEYNYAAKGDRPGDQPGGVKIVVGDFFQRDWEAACASDGVRVFDLIYDYTVCPT